MINMAAFTNDRKRLSNYLPLSFIPVVKANRLNPHVITIRAS